MWTLSRPRSPIPPDRGYVHNFQDPAQPVAVSLPCGMIKGFARDMDELVESCRLEIPKAFESDDYTHRMEEVMKEIGAKRQAMTEEMEREAREAGFALSSTQVGITPVPAIEGRPMTEEEFNALSEEENKKLRERAEVLQHEINHTMVELRRLNKEAVEAAREVDKEVGPVRAYAHSRRAPGQVCRVSGCGDIPGPGRVRHGRAPGDLQAKARAASSQSGRPGGRVERGASRQVSRQRPGGQCHLRGGSGHLRVQPHLLQPVRPHRLSRPIRRPYDGPDHDQGGRHAQGERRVPGLAGSCRRATCSPAPSRGRPSSAR